MADVMMTRERKADLGGYRLLSCREAGEVIGKSEEWVRCQARRADDPIPSVRLPRDDGRPGQRIGIWLRDLYDWSKKVGS